MIQYICIQPRIYMEIEIKKAEPADFLAIHALIQQFAEFIQTPEKVRITPEQMVQDQSFFNCLIACSGEEVIGFATYFFAFYSWTGKAVYLDDLYVLEAYRGAGIGTRLFDEVKEIGGQQGCYKMKWQVSKWNKAAQTFYVSKGASIDEVEINCELML